MGPESEIFEESSQRRSPIAVSVAPRNRSEGAWKRRGRGGSRYEIKAMLPFMSGALGGLLSACSVYGTGAGVTF